MKTEFLDYLNDILDSINKIEKFTERMTFEEFEKDEKTVYAVIRALEIIGEATKKVPIEIKQKHNEIPWRIMAGMRDKLIHEYSGVDMDILWKTIKENIPTIKPLFSKMLKDYK